MAGKISNYIAVLYFPKRTDKPQNTENLTHDENSKPLPWPSVLAKSIKCMPKNELHRNYVAYLQVGVVVLLNKKHESKQRHESVN